MLTTVLLATTVIKVYAPITGLTEPPITYVLDYGSNHVGNAAWVQQVAAAPPDLLHLGKDVTMTHSWGPIRALGGENQAHGKGDAIKLLTVAEAKLRMTNLTAMVKSLHDAGVKMVMPYICAITVGGHHDKRAGFWAFYDSWTKYAAPFDLNLRPAPDPAKWLQRQPNGDFQRFYDYKEDFYPPYEPNHRYAACVNNPNWQHWLTRVVALIARTGCDGVFVDNSGSQRCYCDECKKGFREWVKKRKVADNDLTHADRERNPALYEEAERFWLESLHRHQMRLRTSVMKINPNFKVFPNGGHKRPHAVKLAFADSDYIMFEKSTGQFGTHPGLAGSHLNHNVMELKYVQCLRKLVKPIILTRSGYPRPQPQYEMNRASASLGCAEMAAFGSGGGFLIRPNWPDGQAVIKQYRGFFERNADLYRTNDSFTPVGVAYWAEQNLAGNRKHTEGVRQITQNLLAAHIPFDYAVEECFTNKFFHRYPALIMPEIARADSNWLRAIASWVETGGNVLIVGEHPKDSPLLGMTKKKVATNGLVLRMDLVTDPGDISMWLGNYVHVSPRLLEEDDRPELRNVFVNSFARRNRYTGDVRMAVHLVNYNVPLGQNAPPPKPLADLVLKLPVPRDLVVRGITALDPDAPQADTLDTKKAEHGFWVRVPRLNIYKIVVVDFACTKPPPDLLAPEGGPKAPAKKGPFGSTELR